jgi:beta-ketoacyl-acyl-carrier-protein synthase II
MATIDGKRVVVTGIGVISPLGLDASTMWDNLVAGRSGIRPITLFDASALNVRIAGEAHGFDAETHMSARDARRCDRFAQFAIAALSQTLEQSRLQITDHNADQIGAIVGTGMGGIWTYTRELDVLREKGPGRINPLLIPMITADVPAVQLAMRTGARGPCLGVTSACATGADALGLAYETIRTGRAEAMFAGGFEAAVTPIGIAAFDRMGALSRRNDDPASASRPFDSQRDGFVMGEGGALLVLEELGFALHRGAQPLAEMCGYAATSDAVHITAPDREGAGAAHCMRLAMQRAAVTPADVSYVNAHATSTPLGDPSETRAIKHALGEERARRVPVSGTKSMTGHLLGGAGALEAVICIHALQSNLIPPTINLNQPDPDCDLDYVPHHARAADLEVVLSNSFGFGGHNTTLVFRKFR